MATTCLTVALAGCGGQSSAAGGSSTDPQVARSAASVSQLPTYPIVQPPRRFGQAWKPVATIRGRTAIWIAERAGVTLLRVDQHVVHLALHSGSVDPGGSGWRYGDRIGPSEIHGVVGAFNGGFKLDYGSVGFMSEGRAAVALQPGLASIVTYRDGTTQIGAWREGVAEAGQPIASVLQNLQLLVDRGVPAASTASCLSCWGDTLGGGSEVARSALGITGEGQLVWAAGETLSPAALAEAMTGVGVQRAVELDINPEWVAGYLYVHRPSGLHGAPVVPGQAGIPGRLLRPYERDFFAILAN